jgi:hypothetical protein
VFVGIVTTMDVLRAVAAAAPRISRLAIAAAFGAAVAKGILALSKDEKLPKEQQSAHSLWRIQQQPRG